MLYHRYAVVLSIVALLWSGSIMAQNQVLAQGEFEGRSDHVVTGQVRVVQTDSGYALELGEDFSLDGAPDPKLGFGSDGFDNSTLLPPLASDTGAQSYELPADFDLAAYNEVWLWCVQFDVPLGYAAIK